VPKTLEIQRQRMNGARTHRPARVATELEADEEFTAAREVVPEEPAS
jgi:hypothetical protein